MPVRPPDLLRLLLLLPLAVACNSAEPLPESFDLLAVRTARLNALGDPGPIPEGMCQGDVATWRRVRVGASLLVTPTAASSATDSGRSPTWARRSTT